MPRQGSYRKSGDDSYAYAAQDVRTLVSTLEPEDVLHLQTAAQLLGTDVASAEARLRKLVQLGYLHMAALRDEDGKFIDFTFRFEPGQYGRLVAGLNSTKRDRASEPVAK